FSLLMTHYHSPAMQRNETFSDPVKELLANAQVGRVPVHKRGYFFKIEAHRIFNAQHILICEHLKIRRNDEIGEIDRLWAGTR
ncbi:MAG: hypothetical protein ACC707_16810, partial [Thiohalomonadales bacterium]